MIKIKKLLIFLLCITPLIKVNALEDIVYSEYGDWSEWQEEAVEGDEFTYVEEEKRYRWYKEEKEYSNYYKEDYYDEDYPLIDWDDYVIGPYSDYSEEIPLAINGRTIEEKTAYKYREMEPIKYVFFRKPINGFSYFIIPEINIWLDDEKIDYEFYCSRCSDNFAQYINDGDIYQPDVYMYYDHELIIDLGGYYDATRIKMDVYMYDSRLSHKTFEILFAQYPNVNAPQFFYKSFDEEFYCNGISEVKKFEYVVDESWLKDPLWFDWEISDELVEESLTIDVEPITMYSYSDIYYRRYRVDNAYYDDNYYVLEPLPGYIKDEEDCKYYYRFKTREVIDFEEEQNNDPNVGDDDEENSESRNEAEVDYDETSDLSNEREIDEEQTNQDNTVPNESNTENDNVEEGANDSVDEIEDGKINQDSENNEDETNIHNQSKMYKQPITFDQREEIIYQNISSDKDELNNSNQKHYIKRNNKLQVNKAAAVIKPLIYVLSLLGILLIILIRRYNNRIL